MNDTKPELIGIYNNGITANGGGSGSGGSATPDGSGGLIINVPTGAWLPYEDLGSSAAVTVSAGRAYKLTVGDSCTVSADVKSGYCGPDAYLTMSLANAATVTLSNEITAHDNLTSGKINDCRITFRDTKAFLFVDNVYNS